jgi:hypothetical protein
MKEEVKNEITYIAKKQSKDRLIRWLLISISLIVMLAGAGVMNWLSERDKSKVEILDAVTDLKTEFRTGMKELKDEQALIKNDISDIKTEQSEQKQVTKIVVDQLPEMYRMQVKQTQAIYDQMLRDQSPRDRRESENTSMIEPLPAELNYKAETNLARC